MVWGVNVHPTPLLKEGESNMTDPYELLRRWIFAMILIIGTLLAIMGLLVQGILGSILLAIGVTIVGLAIWGFIKTKPIDGI